MRILITGGNGFIGAWIAKRLAARGIGLRFLDIVESRTLVSRIAGDATAAASEWITGDVVDAATVERAAKGCDGIIHLAGLLTLACKADPLRGAMVNVIGTVNVFETALKHGIRRVVYTSSAGVFGPDDGRQPFPITQYGAFKLACEGSARAYWVDHGLASIGFRPYVVYGPGREGGLTAGPSLACRAAGRGEPFTIPYRGSAGLVYVDDVAAAYELALLREIEGAHVFNLLGVTASNEEVVAAIRAVAPDARIAIDGPQLPFMSEIEEGPVRDVLRGLPLTPLAEGIAETVAYYRRHPD